MSASAAQRLPDDHPAWKDLRPFGYECSRWLTAMGMLQTRWRKGRFNGPLTDFLTAWMPADAVAAQLPEVFEVVFEKGGFHADPALRPVADPVWQALLHLPALRQFWTAELRASHYAHLLRMIPQAWCMDRATLPPGSVIAGLGISHWDELSQLEAPGRRFLRHSVGENKVVLSQVSTNVASWRARYTLREGQIALQDAFLL